MPEAYIQVQPNRGEIASRDLPDCAALQGPTAHPFHNRSGKPRFALPLAGGCKPERQKETVPWPTKCLSTRHIRRKPGWSSYAAIEFEEFDFETAQRKQLRGNIYLAKVTRVEPSLQAAFVDYGGNRHGFLAFSEIHPDYYQIPVADRQALIDEDSRAQRDFDDDDEQRSSGGGSGGGRRRGRNRNRELRRHERPDEAVRSDSLTAEETAREAVEVPSSSDAPTDVVAGEGTPVSAHEHEFEAESQAYPAQAYPEPPAPSIGETANPPAPAEIGAPDPVHLEPASQPAWVEAEPTHSEAHAETGESFADGEHGKGPENSQGNGEPGVQDHAHDHGQDNGHDHAHENGHDEEEEIVDTVGGADAMEEVMERAPRHRRQYKIQEVIKRRQVMLVQVVKEERGTKGAALTTYLSLAGRYSVLMPNTARGGGISRKITSTEDRKKLREIADELEVPEGMGVILRTAGANRTKAEVKRDFEYLLRLWETVRDLTLKSTAPTLVYEEGSLAKRSIRDLYTKDIDEIVVAGEAGYKDAKEFMRMLMPSHAKNVKLYKDTQPVFTRYGIESQLDAMFSPTVQLRSGGYIVINQTEALVSIDVNSGRSTREHHIEDTALKTNVEAAEEVARQLRLRDLAGLIVIDFIDMDEKRNNRTVERRMKDALRNDRARIQVGRISHFGLLEMSRQRIRTSVLESSTEKCPHCGGTGHMRSVSSVALQLLRALDETLQKGATHNQIVRTRPEIALYVLNQKRAHLSALEQRFQITITINADSQIGGEIAFAIDRGEQMMTIDQAKALAAQFSAAMPLLEEEEEPPVDAEFEEIEEEDTGHAPEHAAEGGLDEHDDAPRSDGGEREAGERDVGDRDGLRRRRRRRGRGGRGGEGRGEGRGGGNRGGEGRERAPMEAGQSAQEPAAEQTGADFETYDDAVPAEGGAAPQPQNGGEPARRRPWRDQRRCRASSAAAWPPRRPPQPSRPRRCRSQREWQRAKPGSHAGSVTGSAAELAGRTAVCRIDRSAAGRARHPDGDLRAPHRTGRAGSNARSGRGSGSPAPRGSAATALDGPRACAGARRKRADHSADPCVCSAARRDKPGGG